MDSRAGKPAERLGGGWERIGPPECPILFRRTLVSRRSFKVLWHRFVPGASDVDPHDHPRAFLTIVLRGGYDDVTPLYLAGERVERLRAPAIRYRRAQHAHVTRVHPDGATTLVIMGPLVRAWGFVRDGRWMPWADYERRYGMAFRCDRD